MNHNLIPRRICHSDHRQGTQCFHHSCNCFCCRFHYKYCHCCHRCDYCCCWGFFAVAGVVIGDSDNAIAHIVVADSVIAGVLVYFLLLFPLLLRSSVLILFCKRNSFLNLLI